MTVGLFFVLRLRTTNPLNGNGFGSRFARQGERKRHRSNAQIVTRGWMLGAKLSARDLLPCTVTLRRLTSHCRGLDAHDGLPAALKSIVDGIADALGVDDGGSFVTWHFENKRCIRGCFGVEVQIERRADVTSKPVITATAKTASAPMALETDAGGMLAARRVGAGRKVKR